jgi:hypothetical protein
MTTAPKKAAKKAAKKHSKKHSRKHSRKHAGDHGQRDLLRAYEHLGRLAGLQRAGQQTPDDANTLAALARQQLQAGEAENAAELLRAAEHLCFAALASGSQQVGESAALKAIARERYEHMARKATEQWQHRDQVKANATVAGIYTRTAKQAEQAHAAGAHRKALELARAAQALAELPPLGGPRLAAAKQRHQLNAA